MSEERRIKRPGTDHTVRVMDPREAHESLCRFINSHFRNRTDGEHARFSIPVRMDRDDDMLLSAFIDAAAEDRAEIQRQAEQITALQAYNTAEVERRRAMLTREQAAEIAWRAEPLETWRLLFWQSVFGAKS